MEGLAPQLAARQKMLNGFPRLIPVTPDKPVGLSAPGGLLVAVTPHIASLLDPHDPTSPSAGGFYSPVEKSRSSNPKRAAALSEDAHSPGLGLVPRYLDRVLMPATTQQASNCRFYTQRRLAGSMPFVISVWQQLSTALRIRGKPRWTVDGMRRQHSHLSRVQTAERAFSPLNQMHDESSISPNCHKLDCARL
mgnify:CR=1 FL=1